MITSGKGSLSTEPVVIMHGWPLGSAPDGGLAPAAFAAWIDAAKHGELDQLIPPERELSQNVNPTAPRPPG